MPDVKRIYEVGSKTCLNGNASIIYAAAPYWQGLDLVSDVSFFISSSCNFMRWF